MDKNNGFEIDDEYVTNRHGHHHHHRRPQKRKPFLSPLILVIIFEGLIIASLTIWITLREKDIKDLSERAYQLSEGLKSKKAEIEGLRYDFKHQGSSGQESCSSKMITFKFDEFLEINKNFVKSAFFVLSGKATNKVIEYKLILKNDSDAFQRPKFTMVFINLAGNPIGEVKFGDSESGRALTLEKSEVKTVDGKFEVGNNPLPEAFTIKGHE